MLEFRFLVCSYGNYGPSWIYPGLRGPGEKQHNRERAMSSEWRYDDLKDVGMMT